MNDIAKAERVSSMRAIILALLAAALIASVIMGGDPSVRPSRLVAWLAVVALGLANLVTVGLIRSPRLKALVDDESTHLHRSKAMTCGFAAAIASGMALAITATMTPLPALLVAKVIVTASLAAALIAFATLELRAAR